MNIIYNLIFTISALSIMASCASDSPFVSKEEVEEMLAARDPFRDITNIIAAINNDIYYFEHMDSLPQRITHSPDLVKTDVKLSADGSKIAYLDNNRSPVIIDLQGRILNNLTSYKNIKQYDWTNDDQSLYMLIGDQVFVHGQELSIVEPDMPHAYDEVLSFSMNNNGDQAYIIYQYKGFAGNSGNFLQYYSPDHEIDTLISTLHGEFGEFGYVDLVDEDGSFVITYENNNNQDFSVYCHINHQFYTEYDWEHEFINTPLFNAEKEVLLFGSVGETSFIEAVYLGTELYYGRGLQGIKSKTLHSFPSDTPIYLDWKQ